MDHGRRLRRRQRGSLLEEPPGRWRRLPQPGPLQVAQPAGGHLRADTASPSGGSGPPGAGRRSAGELRLVEGAQEGRQGNGQASRATSSGAASATSVPGEESRPEERPREAKGSGRAADPGGDGHRHGEQRGELREERDLPLDAGDGDGALGEAEDPRVSAVRVLDGEDRVVPARGEGGDRGPREVGDLLGDQGRGQVLVDAKLGRPLRHRHTVAVRLPSCDWRSRLRRCRPPT